MLDGSNRGTAAVQSSTRPKSAFTGMTFQDSVRRIARALRITYFAFRIATSGPVRMQWLAVVYGSAKVP
jgi:hypothetical protein